MSTQITIGDLLAMPLSSLFGATAMLSAVAAGTVALVKWGVGTVLKRAQVREARIDGSTDKLIAGTLGWADDMRSWAHGLQAEVADCKKHHDECRQELALMRARGQANQEAQKIIAAEKIVSEHRGREQP